MSRERRIRVLQALEEAVMILPAATPKLRGGDTYYRYAPDSDLYYLTGFTEPHAILVLAPGNAGGEHLLFLRPRDPDQEAWDGPRLGVERAVEALALDAAYPIEEFDRRLPDLLQGRESLYFRHGVDPEADSSILSFWTSPSPRARRGTLPVRWIDPGSVLNELRLVKDGAEQEVLRRAAAISCAAHVEAMQAVRPGLHEYEIESVVEAAFRRRGASGPAYPSIVASGPNATVLHHIENDRRLAEGDLLLLDAACELSGYKTDLTRTFPASGRFAPEQRRVYDVVLRAQRAAIEAVRPGSGFFTPHLTAVRHLTEGLLSLGVLHGDPEELVRTQAYRRFYRHGTSHWLGLDVHDVGVTANGTPAGRPLQPGMVLTVEPGLYFPADDDLPPALRGLGIRIEDDVLVTAEGHEVLTREAPKEPEEVEQLTARGP